MSGRPALEANPVPPRVLVVAGAAAREVFQVVALDAGVLRARAVYLFERGEKLRIRVEGSGGAARDAVARVRGHHGPDDAPITELELEPASGTGTELGPGGPGEPEGT